VVWRQNAAGVAVDAAAEALGKCSSHDDDHLRRRGLLQVSLCSLCGVVRCLLHWHPALLAAAARLRLHGHLRPAGCSNAPLALCLRVCAAVPRGHLQCVQVSIAGPQWIQCGGARAPSSHHAPCALWLPQHLDYWKPFCCSQWPGCLRDYPPARVTALLMPQHQDRLLQRALLLLMQQTHCRLAPIGMFGPKTVPA